MLINLVWMYLITGATWFFTIVIHLAAKFREKHHCVRRAVCSLAHWYSHVHVHTQRNSQCHLINCSVYLHICRPWRGCTECSEPVRIWKQVWLCDKILVYKLEKHTSMRLRCNTSEKRLDHKHIVLEWCISLPCFCTKNTMLEFQACWYQLPVFLTHQ